MFRAGDWAGFSEEAGLPGLRSFRTWQSRSPHPALPAGGCSKTHAEGRGRHPATGRAGPSLGSDPHVHAHAQQGGEATLLKVDSRLLDTLHPVTQRPFDWLHYTLSPRALQAAFRLSPLLLPPPTGGRQSP